MLRRIFKLSEQNFYNVGETLFKVGDPQDSIYIILFGVVETGLSDGERRYQ